MVGYREGLRQGLYYAFVNIGGSKGLGLGGFHRTGGYERDGVGGCIEFRGVCTTM